MAATVWTLTVPAMSGQSELSLDALTVPSGRLQPGCSLPPAPNVKVEGKAIRAGLWAGLPISSNPWRGDDAAALAAIYQRIAPPEEVPDGPPLSPRELALFRARFARDLEEAYAALYAPTSANPSDVPSLVAVYAVRFKDLRAIDRLRSNPKLAANVRSSGRTAFVLTGRDSQCLEIVADHLRTLLPR